MRCILSRYVNTIGFIFCWRVAFFTNDDIIHVTFKKKPSVENNARQNVYQKKLLIWENFSSNMMQRVFYRKLWNLEAWSLWVSSHIPSWKWCLFNHSETVEMLLDSISCSFPGRDIEATVPYCNNYKWQSEWNKEISARFRSLLQKICGS